MGLCQTGEPYVALGTPRGSGRPGIMEPGTLPERFISEWSACAAALRAFDIYAEGKDGTLFWRQMPKLDEVKGRYAVHMRLVISESMPRWATVNDFIDQEIAGMARCTPR